MLVAAGLLAGLLAFFQPGWLPALATLPGGPKILLGDLNITPWSYFFGRLLRTANLRDPSVGIGFKTTWPVGQILLRIPIDHCLVSPEIAVEDRRVGTDVGSDHFPLVVDFALVAR